MSLNQQIHRLANGKQACDITRRPVETSIIFYRRNNRLYYLKGYDYTGTDSFVKFTEPKKIVQRCRQLGSSEIIFMHNHPMINGKVNTLPSRMDIRTTEKMIAELKRYGIRVLDHIIVTPQNYFSFHQQEMI